MGELVKNPLHIETGHFTSGEAFFGALRDALDRAEPFFMPEGSVPPESFPADGAHIYISLFHDGLPMLRWGSRRKDFAATVERIRGKLCGMEQFSKYDVSDPVRCRIMLEYVTETRNVADTSALRIHRLDDMRLEPGIDGLMFTWKDQLRVYMPSEAYTRSHMTETQMIGWIARRCGITDRKTGNQTAWKDFVSAVPSCTLIRSEAFMADASGVHPLYRGFPMPLPNRVEDARQAAIDSSDLITATMKESGAFLYYYDAVRDSVDDHIHPNPRYYNILRHNGGIITLLRAFEATRHVKYLAPARRAIDFLLERSKYEEENPDRLYVFYNKKAKLGGTGTALVALMLYYHLTGDDRYIEPAAAMARHLIGRIAGDGEFIGYYIHPGHQDGAPLVDVTAEDRRPLFSFYYPGEALLGMALFDLQAPGHEKLKQELRSNGRRALDFLMDERPKRYPELFLTLPADSWLMQAIEAWWDREEMQDERYRAFVFSDGHQMLDHMYTQDNAPYPDYPGSFYYHYGDHTLPDGSRVEGLVAALHLAKKTGDDKLYKEFDEACRMAIRTLLQTHNSEAACYFMRDRTRALGGFRFKYTRHWNRVDSTQHAACAIYRWLLAEQA